MQISNLNIDLTARRGRGVPTAPDYVEPVGDDPVAPPAGDPVPPTDTPTDPETDAPEPGIDPDFTSATRIEIIDGQAVERTTNDPGTFGVSYVAAELSANEYWEFTVANSTPKNATFAVGVTTLAMPLNGIPGDRATELAWWSDGTVRQNDATLIDLAADGRLARGDRGAIAFGPSGEVRLYKNCTALNAGAAVGSLVTASKVFPFVALFSARTRIDMVFTLGKFGCPVPEGYYPIGQVVVSELDIAATLSGKTYFHIDISDTATLFQNADGTNPVTATGQEVKSIREKSPAARLFANTGISTAGSFPIYQVDSNGKPYLDANGNDQLEVAVDLTAFSKVSMVAGVQKDSDVKDTQIINHQGIGSRSFRLSGPSVNAATNFTFATRSDNPPLVTIEAVASPFAAPQKVVLSGSGDFALGASLVRVNGVQFDATGTAAPDSLFSDGVVRILGRTGSGSEGFIGRFYGAVIWMDSPEVSTIMAPIEEYMTGRLAL